MIIVIRDKARIYQMDKKEMDLVNHKRKQIAIRYGFGFRDKEEKNYRAGEL